MTWNYRIIVFGTYDALHEVYYDDEGRPTGYTASPATFLIDADEFKDEPDALVKSLEMALRDALELPMLDARVFEMPVEDRPVCPRRNTSADNASQSG